MVNNHNHLKRRAEALTREHDLAAHRAADERKRFRTAEAQHTDAVAAQELLQEVAVAVQRDAHERVATVVTRCLRAVFGEEYGFEIEFERKRGRTEAALKFLRCGEKFDPELEMGGGILDVSSFALRLACLLLHKPPLRRLLVLDEPFRMLSINHHECVADLLLTLAKELKVQIVLISHSEMLAVGKVVHMGRERRDSDSVTRIYVGVPLDTSTLQGKSK